ncbi:MAG: hypothetical protein M1817_003947 [Caeruleum heppii]|nr:MAG: hypothetical protein M1817_003947 [Caeruleum heppii]
MSGLELSDLDHVTAAVWNPSDRRSLPSLTGSRSSDLIIREEANYNSELELGVDGNEMYLATTSRKSSLCSAKTTRSAARPNEVLLDEVSEGFSELLSQVDASEPTDTAVRHDDSQSELSEIRDPRVWNYGKESRDTSEEQRIDSGPRGMPRLEIKRPSSTFNKESRTADYSRVSGMGCVGRSQGELAGWMRQNLEGSVHSSDFSSEVMCHNEREAVEGSHSDKVVDLEKWGISSPLSLDVGPIRVGERFGDLLDTDEESVILSPALGSSLDLMQGKLPESAWA